MKQWMLAAAMILGLAFAPIAHAEVKTFEVKWSGAAYGNAATAEGLITLETTGNQLIGELLKVEDYVMALQVEVKGSNFGIGDGVFDLDDFLYIAFYARHPLDLDKELIGQVQADGCVFGSRAFTDACPRGSTGDFRVYRKADRNFALIGFDYFMMQTSAGDLMDVTSIRAVPEPGAWALMILGFGAVGGALRRRRAAFA